MWGIWGMEGATHGSPLRRILFIMRLSPNIIMQYRIAAMMRK